jgi:hypothetical protein
MIMRGGGAIGAVGLTGVDACICMTLFAGGCAAGGALPVCAAGVTRGGTAMAGGALVLVADELAPGAVGGGAETFGGITTTDGGRNVAATEAGVTILGVGGGVTGASATGFDGVALGAAGADGASVFASTVGVATGLATERATGGSGTTFCCVIARSTSPGREIFERSILVLMPSSSRAEREAFAELDPPSERPRRCFRTKSAS